MSCAFVLMWLVVCAMPGTARAASDCDRAIEQFGREIQPKIDRFFDIQDVDEACDYGFENVGLIEDFGKKFDVVCKGVKGVDAWSVEDDLDSYAMATFGTCGY